MPTRVLLAPGLRLADLQDPQLPNLNTLARTGTLALVNGLTARGQAELRLGLAGLPGPKLAAGRGRFLLPAIDRPYGVAADLDALARATADFVPLAIVEPGDLERALRYALLCFPEPAARHRAAALADLDLLIGRLWPPLAARGGVLHLLVPVPATPGPLGMGLWVAAGASFRPGVFRTGSTRTPGVVARADVVAALKGGVGPSLAVLPGSLADLDRLARDSERAERLRRPAWGLLRGGLLLLAAIALPVAARPRLARALLPAALALLLLAFLTGDLVAAPGWARAAWHGAILMVTVGTACVRREAAVPLLAAIVLLLLGEVLSGGHLLRWSALGYSLALGARSYGIGNEAVGVLLGATILLPFAAAPLWRGTRCAAWMGALLWLLVTVAIGSPTHGSDFGGALSSALAAGVALPALHGQRLKARHLLLALAALVVLGVLLALWDASRPPEARSHLGRLVASAGKEGLAPLAAVAKTKAATALRVAGSVWGLLLVVEAWIGWVLLRRASRGRGRLARIDAAPDAGGGAGGDRSPRPADTPALSVGLRQLLPAAAALLLFNDSGVVAASLCLALLPAGAAAVAAGTPIEGAARSLPPGSDPPLEARAG
jgi:hypothetical protein